MEEQQTTTEVARGNPSAISEALEHIDDDVVLVLTLGDPIQLVHKRDLKEGGRYATLADGLEFEVIEIHDDGSIWVEDPDAVNAGWLGDSAAAAGPFRLVAAPDAGASSRGASVSRFPGSGASTSTEFITPEQLRQIASLLAPPAGLESGRVVGIEVLGDWWDPDEIFEGPSGTVRLSVGVLEPDDGEGAAPRTYWTFIAPDGTVVTSYEPL